MKPAQWTLALVVLVVMVFLVTFAMNYVSGPTDPGSGKPTGDGKEKQAASLAQLTFPVRAYPDTKQPGAAASIDWEHRKPGHQDFWFVNDNPEAVRFGLDHKNCTCTGVQVLLLQDPQRYQKRKDEVEKAATAAAEAVRAVAAGTGLSPLPLVPAVPAPAEPAAKDPELAEMAAAAKKLSLEGPTDEVTVPPGGAGWVRVLWTGEKAGPQNLKATLWFGARGAGSTAVLLVNANFLPPLRIPENELVAKEVRSPLPLASLPYKDSFLVWSSTRPSFELAAQVIKTDGRLASDPFTIGKPERLSAQECQALEKDLGYADAGKVLCAYRVPLTIHKQSADGKTAIDLGPLRRQLEFSIVGDPDVEPVRPVFMATIQGDVQVGNGREIGRVDLGPFNRDVGSKKVDLVLSTTRPGVTLTIDRQRTSSFLTAHLSEPEEAPGGRRIWKLTVSVEPNKASGRFRREDDPTYQDSAVYVNTTGVETRSIRIPVSGEAIDR
jgi:hypothetical protein